MKFNALAAGLKSSAATLMTSLRHLKTAAFAAVVLTVATSASAGNNIYQTGTGNPWGSNSNETAMDTTFGAGNWSKNQGFDMNSFTGASFVYMDGSDSQANQMSSFIATNQSAIESFVFNGGHLFINAAPNQGGSFSMGFGTTLNNGAFSGTANITAAGIAAGLTNGGIATNYTGSWFSHATVSGSFTSLIEGDVGTIFGAMQYGNGFVAFGGQTTANFHSPSVDAAKLLTNQLAYVAAPVPEPETYAMLLAGLGLIGAASRRRKAAAQATA